MEEAELQGRDGERRGVGNEEFVCWVERGIVAGEDIEARVTYDA